MWIWDRALQVCRAVALRHALCFASEPQATFPGTCNSALLSCIPHQFLILQRQLHFWWVVVVQVIFQFTHRYTVNFLIIYHSCLEWFREPVLTSLMMFQRKPGDHLSKHRAFQSSSSPVYLNRYWLVAHACKRAPEQQGSDWTGIWWIISIFLFLSFF